MWMLGGLYCGVLARALSEEPLSEVAAATGSDEVIDGQMFHGGMYRGNYGGYMPYAGYGGNMYGGYGPGMVYGGGGMYGGNHYGMNSGGVSAGNMGHWNQGGNYSNSTGWDRGYNHTNSNHYNTGANNNHYNRHHTGSLGSTNSHLFRRRLVELIDGVLESHEKDDINYEEEVIDPNNEVVDGQGYGHGGGHHLDHGVVHRGHPRSHRGYGGAYTAAPLSGSYGGAFMAPYTPSVPHVNYGGSRHNLSDSRYRGGSAGHYRQGGSYNNRSGWDRGYNHTNSNTYNQGAHKQGYHGGNTQRTSSGGSLLANNILNTIFGPY